MNRFISVLGYLALISVLATLVGSSFIVYGAIFRDFEILYVGFWMFIASLLFLLVTSLTAAVAYSNLRENRESQIHENRDQENLNDYLLRHYPNRPHLSAFYTAQQQGTIITFPAGFVALGVPHAAQPPHSQSDTVGLLPQAPVPTTTPSVATLGEASALPSSQVSP